MVARAPLPAWLAATVLFLGCTVGAEPATADEDGGADGGADAIPARAVASDHTTCPGGAWPDETGRCVAAEDAFTAPGGTAYWVDNQHPRAGDDNPGTAERPWRTVGRATETLRPGDAVIVRAGVYRETLTPRTGGVPGRRVTYAAYPGDRVIVTGTDVVTGWTRDGEVWWTPWIGPPLRTYADEPHFRRELVVADGEVLRPVYRRADLVPGTFFADGLPEAPRALVARFPDDAVPGTVEVAYRTYLFRPLGGDPEPECGAADTPGWLRVVGFTFRHAANRAQWGAVCFGSEGALVEDVTVEETNGLGIAFGGSDHVFLRTVAQRNGQMGWGGACVRCLFEDNASIDNNWKGHDPAWEAGGGKWHHTRETVIRRHYARGNDGPGLWLDGANTRNTIEDGLFVDNALAGVMLELETTRTLVQRNRILGTRFLGYAGAGILSQAASQNAYVHNTITGNVTGLWLRLDPDRRAPDGHNVVLNNVLVGNVAAAREERGEEARELSVEGTSGAHTRTNRLDGNVYGRVDGDLRVSTFYFYPDPESGPANFRSGDLDRWQALTGERCAALLAPGLVGADGSLAPRASVPEAVAVEGLDGFGASSAPAVQAPRPGVATVAVLQ